ncbi:response regulator [bacterium]|nr:MAG: response regulator [bacterium]
MAKILLADDEQDIVEFFGRILYREGFEVVTATNGEACVDLAKKTHPDLIMLDINMPKMDGGAVAQKLSEDKMTANIPVIFVSGIITKADEGTDRGRLMISKGSSKEEIIKKIKMVLNIK